MEQITIGQVVIIAGLITAFISIASFYLGRRNAATSEGKAKGVLESDMCNIKKSIEELSKTFTALNIKLDLQSEKREQEYREMLIRIVKLDTNYETLDKRMSNLDQKFEGMNR